MNDANPDFFDIAKVIAHLRENPMLLATIGYLFLFIFRPFEYWEWLGNFRIERIYALGLMFAVFAWQEKQHIPHVINRTLVVFFLVMCFSILIAYRSDVASDQVFKYFKLLIFYFIILFTVNSKKDFNVLILAFILILGLYVGKSLWEYLLNGRGQYRMGIRRLTGIDKTYDDPNSFASTVLYSLPFAVALFKSREFERIRKWILLYGGICITAIILTGSRGGMVCTALFFLLSVIRGNRKVKAFALMIVGFAIAWAFMPEDIHTRLETIVDPSANKAATESAKGRLDGLVNGFRLFAISPVWGWGTGNFMYATPLLGVEGDLQAHNLYGQLAAELGILGIFAFLTFTMASLCTMRRIRRNLLSHAETDRYDFLLNINEACFQGFFLLLINGFLGHSLYRYNWVLFGAFLVITDHLQEISQKEAKKVHDSGKGMELKMIRPFSKGLT